MLAVDTWHIKYTSEVILEALPGLAALLGVLCYLRSRRRPSRWLVVSGVAFGVAAASKYIYAVVAVAVLADWLLSEAQERRQRRGRGLVADEGPEERRCRATHRPPLPTSPRPSPRAVTCSVPARVALSALVITGVFFVATSIFGRTARSAAPVAAVPSAYAAGPTVTRVALPPWQPVVWLSKPVPAHDSTGIFKATGGHRGVFLVTADTVIGALAIAESLPAWRRHRVFVLWLEIGLAFLLVWPSKWPQYTMLLTIPMSVCAADALRRFVWEPLLSPVRRMVHGGGPLRRFAKEDPGVP